MEAMDSMVKFQAWHTCTFSVQRKLDSPHVGKMSKLQKKQTPKTLRKQYSQM